MRSLYIFFVVVSLSAGAARAEEPAVAESTDTVKPRTVEDIYIGAKYRNPFTEVTAAAGGRSVSAAAYNPEDFSIHELDLRGIMRDKTGAFAILTDRVAGVGFVLRQGKLYDYRNKLVPDVKGRINMAQKTVYLITPEKDVQTLRLGEDEEDE